MSEGGALFRAFKISDSKFFNTETKHKQKITGTE